MNRYSLTMTDWKGTDWDFTNDWAAGIKAGGIDGLIGTMDTTTATPLATPGQTALSQRAGVMTGALTFLCRAAGGRDAGEVAAALRAAFSPLAHQRSLLKLSTPAGDMVLWVRLGEGMAAPTQDPSWSEVVLDVRIPLVADDGVWWTMPEQGTGTVTITNDGDVPVAPTITWSGAGGVVKVPSGAMFQLPAVTSQHTLVLQKIPKITANNEPAAPEVTHALRAIPIELVPPGATRQFHVPPGATIQWKKGVLDPWR